MNKNLFLYLTVLTTGFIVLVIEIAGARLISPFFGSTIFVWASLISVTLGALSLGYWFGGNLADKEPNYKYFYLIIFISGVSVLFIFNFYQPILIFSDNFGLRFGPLIASFILFFLPLSLLGAVSPYSIRLSSSSLDKSGSTSGKIFAFSTIGSLAGAVISGFFLVPTVKLSLIFWGVAVALVLIGFLGFHNFYSRKNNYFLLALTLLFFLIIGVYNFSARNIHRFNLIHNEQSLYGDLKIVEFGNERCLMVNGTPQSCTPLDTSKFYPRYSYQKEISNFINSHYAGHSSGEPFKILMIGLGGGDLLDLLPEDANVDIVEIDPRIVALAKNYFEINLGNNKKIFVDDARNFLRTRSSDKKYDVVIGDAYQGNSVPYHLVSSEFFSLVKTNLSDDGIILVNLLSTQDIKNVFLASVVKTVRQVFPSVFLFLPQNQIGGVSNAVLHVSNKEDVNLETYDGVFAQVLVDESYGGVITDEKNSSELIRLSDQDSFRNSIVRSWGYSVMMPSL